MLKIEGLNKSFGKNHILKDINLSLEKGEIAALMGPNGSGKTTLLKSILGLSIPESGKIFVNNMDTSGNFLYRNFIGYMPQIANYPENLRVKELFEIVKDIHSNNEFRDEELIESFKMKDIYGKSFGQLSGGFKQRVSGTIAFIFDPELLILDEPTASLDPLSNEIMKHKILKAKQKNKTVLVTSHTLSEADELADRLIYMLEGKIILDKPVSEIKNGSGGIKLGAAVKKFIGEM